MMEILHKDSDIYQNNNFFQQVAVMVKKATFDVQWT